MPVPYSQVRVLTNTVVDVWAPHLTVVTATGPMGKGKLNRKLAIL